MNKYTLMQKQLVRRGVIALISVAVSAAAMMAVESLAEDAIKDKDTAAANLAADENQLREVKSKIDLSTGAEKRFAEIQLLRVEPSFLAKTELLVQLLQESKARYRLTSFKPLNLPPEIPSKLPQLTDKEYDVMVRDGVAIEFEAISDVHVYSFIRHLLAYAPGFLRLQSIDLVRKEDLSPQVITQLQTGQTLSLVVAKLQFTWAGIKAKPEKKDAIPAGGSQ